MNHFARIVLLLCFALPGSVMAQKPWSLSIDAAAYSRAHLIDPSDNGATPADVKLIPQIKQTHHLAGQGWVDYDFSVPESGWYTIGLPANDSAGDTDFFVDCKVHTYGGVTGRILSAYLVAGAHTLRVQRLTWTGLPGVGSFVVQRSTQAVADTVRVQVVNDSLILRKSDPLLLDIITGGRTKPATLNATVKDAKTNTAIRTYTVNLPAASGPAVKRLKIECPAEGIFFVSFGDQTGTIDPRILREIQFVVIDTTSRSATSGDMQKTLLKSIDCATEAPFASSGETSVVTTDFGSYRESGSHGYLESKKNYDFFSYKVHIPEPQRPYLVEVDYPDDDLRTFLIALMEKTLIDYPPVGGVDSGGGYRLTHRMQTQTFIYYPRDPDFVVGIVNAQDGIKAAAARIRIYRIDGPLPGLKLAEPAGRDFGYWLEEGDRWAAFNGAPDKSMSGYLVSMNRWAETARYMGVNTLMPTVAIYQNVLYPSEYYTGWFRASGGPRDPMTLDVVRMLLLVCEKYGLKLLPEFHPTWNGYKRLVDDAPYVSDPDPKPHLMVSRDGEAINSPFRPYFNPLYPANQEWYTGMIGEFAGRYKDSPALMGVGLRVMGWVWESYNGWPSLFWGYDDYTVHLFEKQTGIKIPVADSDPKRFRARYDWLLANAKDKWIDWRCDQIAGLYSSISARVRSARKDLMVVSPVHGQLDDSCHAATERFDVGDYKQIYRESGYDMDKIGRILNTLFLNAIYYYGRRQQDPITEQKEIDHLLDPAARTAFVGSTGRTGFLFSNSYFEADETIDPVKMGLPGAKAGGWDGVANPPGRQYLQRYALDLADSDASLLIDGGEGYIHGQPPLREFLANYRVLPVNRFIPRADATDPVAVWQLKLGGAFWFYAVNRESYSVPITVHLSGSGPIVRAATGEAAKLAGDALTVDMQPYELAVFKAPATRSIETVSTSTPTDILSHLAAQVRWLAALNVDVRADSHKLWRQQPAILDRLSKLAAQQLSEGHVFAVQATLWNHDLLQIYKNLGRCPPDLFEGCSCPPLGPN